MKLYDSQMAPNPRRVRVFLAEKAVEMWQRRMEFEVLNNVAGCFRNTRDYFKGRIRQVPEYGELCRETGLKRLDWLDEALSDREFVAGGRYSIADITAMVGIDFGRVAGIRMQPDQKNLARWHERVSARDSASA